MVEDADFRFSDLENSFVCEMSSEYLFRSIVHDDRAEKEIGEKIKIYIINYYWNFIRYIIYIYIYNTFSHRFVLSLEYIYIRK